MFSAQSISELGQAPLIIATIFPFNWNTLFSGSKPSPSGVQVQLCWEPLAPGWAPVSSALILLQSCHAQIRLPSPKPNFGLWQMDLLSHSLTAPRSWIVQTLSDPFSSHGVPVVHACSRCLLSVSAVLSNFSFHKCHEVSRTSLGHICVAQCSVSVGCSFLQCHTSLPREAAEVLGAVELYEHPALPGLMYPTAPMSRFIPVMFAGISPKYLQVPTSPTWTCSVGCDTSPVLWEISHWEST